MSPQVLVVSRDPMLLHTRQLILGTFFPTDAAGRIREAEALMSTRRYDLIILCYTLTDAERAEVMELAAEQKSHPKVLALSPVGTPEGDPAPGHAAMNEAGPYYLLKKSAQMLGVDISLNTRLVQV